MRKTIISAYLIRIAIAVMALLVGGLLFLRVDLSRGKNYSISAQSKETVRSLRDPVLIKVYQSKNLPTEFGQVSRALRDLLPELQRNSKGRLRYEYVRAATNEELLEKARAMGINPYVTTTQGVDELVSKEVVVGISLEGGGKAEQMVFMPGMEGKLEYQLIKKLGNLDGQPRPKLTVFADSLALLYMYSANRDELATFIYELDQNYEVIYTDLTTPPQFTPVMFFLGVIKDLEREQLYNFDQYLMRGGKVVMTQDRALIYTSPEGTAVLQIDSNLFDQLAHYGVVISPNVVLDRECEIRQGAGMGTQAPYPFIPLVRGNPKFEYTKGFDTIYHFLASEIVPAPGTKIKLEPVLQTSNRSNRLVGPAYQVEGAINRALDPGFLTLPAMTVAAEVSGTFNSYFAQVEADSAFIASTDKARLIIFGDSELPLDFSGGAFVVVNAIDHLLGRGEAIQLRSRNPQSSRLSAETYIQRFKLNPSDPAKAVAGLRTRFKLISVLAPLLLLGILGAGIGIWRRRQA